MSEISIDAMLQERGEIYGAFNKHAMVTQEMKSIFRRHYNNVHSWDLDQQQLIFSEAVDMILHKLGRLANGDIDHIDTWADIAGYATLVVKYLVEGGK